jgi:hypothetical protein
MAEVAVATAYVTVGDQTKSMGRVGIRVSEADGKAFLAAADTAARSATDVGVMLGAISNLFKGNPNTNKSRGVDIEYVNDAFAFPAITSDSHLGNKLNVFYSTTLGGLPRNLSFSIPMRDELEYEFESNGINVVLTDGADIAALVTALEATMLSLYGTAVVITEITVND